MVACKGDAVEFCQVNHSFVGQELKTCFGENGTALEPPVSIAAFKAEDGWAAWIALRAIFWHTIYHLMPPNCSLSSLHCSGEGDKGSHFLKSF